MPFSPMGTSILTPEKAHWSVVFIPLLQLNVMRFWETSSLWGFVVNASQDAWPFLASAALLGEAIRAGLYKKGYKSTTYFKILL